MTQHQTKLAALALFAATVALYAPTLQSGFIWDDEHYVEFNPTLRDTSGLVDIWTDTSATPQYYPLVHTTYWIEYQLWELAPRGYHATNILLHAIASVLLGLLLRRLEVPGAWVCAAVFAVHPVQVESVAWITERKNVLALPFYLASALVYLRWRDAPNDRTRPKLYAAAFSLFVAALLSKTVACSLPAALLIVVWWRNGRITRGDVVPLTPFFVVGFALGLTTVFLEKAQVGATGAEWDFNWIERCLIAGRALWFYAAKIFWPNNFTFFYPRWTIDASQISQYLYPVAAIVALIAAQLGREVWGRSPLAALLIFGGTLVPALGFFDVYPMRFSFVADHFQYLATPALIALIIGSAIHGLEQLPGSPAAKRYARWLAQGALLLGLCVLNLQHQPNFKDLETLWRSNLEANPASWAAAHNLAMDLSESGKPLEAMALFRQSLRHKPDHLDASNGLAIVLNQRGRQSEAVSQYRASLAIAPDEITALNNLARILATARDPSIRDLVEAEQLANRAVELGGDRNARVHAVRAEVHFALERLQEAIDSAQKAVALAQQSTDAELLTEVQTRLEFYRLLQTSEDAP